MALGSARWRRAVFPLYDLHLRLLLQLYSPTAASDTVRAKQKHGNVILGNKDPLAGEPYCLAVGYSSW